MELKRFIGENSREALEQVKQHHGEDALIISTNKIGRKTEVICAIDEISENQAKKTSGQKPKDSIPPKTDQKISTSADNSKDHPELSDEIFSEQLGRIVSKAGSKSRKKEPNINELMKTIQEDLADLRNNIEKQSGSVTPISKARTALNAFTKHEIYVEQEKQIAHAITNLLTRPIYQQRTWSGINMFFGAPGAGKSKIIETLIRGMFSSKKGKQATALIEFKPENPTLGIPSNSMNLAQHFNIACYRETTIENLLARIEEIKTGTNILIEASFYNLDLQPLIPEEHEGTPINQHLCLAADCSPSILGTFTESAPDLLKSVIMTRLDLIPEINGLISALAESSASIQAVASQTGKYSQDSVDLAAEESSKII